MPEGNVGSVPCKFFHRNCIYRGETRTRRHNFVCKWLTGITAACCARKFSSIFTFHKILAWSECSEKQLQLWLRFHWRVCVELQLVDTRLGMSCNEVFVPSRISVFSSFDVKDDNVFNNRFAYRYGIRRRLFVMWDESVRWVNVFLCSLCRRSASLKVVQQFL